MAKKDKINIDNTGVDKLEHFMESNIKAIIVFKGSVSSLV